MAKVMKKMIDVAIGDKVVVVKTVVSKVEDKDNIELTFDDGSTMRAAKAADPAIEVGV